MDTAPRMHRHHLAFAAGYLIAMFLNGAGGTLAMATTSVPRWPIILLHLVLTAAMIWHLHRADEWSELRRIDQLAR